LTSVGAITIPSATSANFGGQGGVRLFDLRELDRVPRRVRTVMPVYPHELRRAGIKGDVVLLVIIDVSGHVEVERVISSTHREFEIAAIKAAEQCQFESPLRAGQRVNARYMWNIPFDLK
jgi:protein TonB